MKIEKFYKQISFPKPKSGLVYTPTEFVEFFIENVDSQDRRFVIKKVIKMKLVPINNFSCGVETYPKLIKTSFIFTICLITKRLY